MPLACRGNILDEHVLPPLVASAGSAVLGGGCDAELEWSEMPSLREVLRDGC